MTEKGGISVQTEHIFPIIKRWLYSEKDIFLREIVSNAADAESKLKHLIAIGEAQVADEDFKIKISVDKDNKTLTVSDNGIGMTDEEVKKYINQIALSGALDFIQKYDGKDDSEDAAKSGIIGHFGLGFYSAFMVADKVDILTKSFTDEPAVFWTCTDDGDYEMKTAEKAERGTDIILHINDDNKEYLEEDKVRETAEKYCSFMAFPVFLGDKQISDTEPLWLKNPSQCTDEEYSDFYKKVFHDYNDSLFHIHINADYPLNFKGILYFPKTSHEYQNLDGEIKLYYNRVFVADNIKEVIPEYLLMLKGVVDCPDLPLNVSRSYLQTNSYVAKVSAHIVKKVCDKINSLFNTERKKFEGMYEDLKVFLEYACLKDEKFYDRIKSSLLFRSVSGGYKTLSDCLENNEEKKIYYASDVEQQSVYINMFKNENIDVVVMDKVLDNQFISLLEYKNEGVKFLRVDASSDALKTDNEGSEDEQLEKLFREVSGRENLKVTVSALKDKTVPAVLNISEEARRFNDMLKMYGMYNGKDVSGNQAPEEYTLSLNSESAIVGKLKNLPEDEARTVAKQIFSLALLSQRRFTAEELSEFVKDSYSLLEKM